MKPIKQPLTLFLLGATGDLAKKKILKAIYELYRQDLLPQPFNLIAVGRSKLSNREYVQLAAKAIKPQDVGLWENFRETIHYLSGDLSQLETYEQIKQLHDTLNICGNHLWYAATLPSLYVDVARFIGQVGLNQTHCGWTKFLIEKPFGVDFESATQLNQFLTTIFNDDQIYRIDHFLAKETVQNLLAFRFANGIFEHLWSNRYIDHIQVLASETIGVEGRGELYESMGLVRDVIQNHVLQLIAMTMMEEPGDLSPQEIAIKRNELLQLIKIEKTRFGQYDQYVEDTALPMKTSKTETAVVARLSIDNSRWRGVPIYVRAGKKLHTAVTEISLQFKEPRNQMFLDRGQQQPNVLTLRIQPNEGVVLRLQAKKPGLKLAVEDVPMQFCYQNSFQMDLVEAYVKLIYDATNGDSMLFPDRNGIELAWKVVEPLLIQKRQPEFKVDKYKSGSWGPKSFEKFMEKDKRSWFTPSELFCQTR